MVMVGTERAFYIYRSLERIVGRKLKREVRMVIMLFRETH